MVITSKKENTATIKFYAQIGRWEYNGKDFSRIFEELDSKYDNIIIRLHSYGGEVFEGNVIFNTILNAKATTTIIIDGVAASMGSIIMLAADKIQMAENAFVMIHNPSGYTSGNARKHLNTAKLLRSLEQVFAKKYAARTGKPETEVKKWFDGSDYWFTAKECLEMKLIDSIIEPVAKDIEKLDKQQASMLGTQAVYEKYFAKLSTSTKSKLNNMDKTQIIARFALLGLTVASSDSDILEAVDKKIQEAETAKVKAEKALADFRKSEIENIVNTAIKEGRIKQAQKESFINIGEKAGVDSLQASLGGIQKHTPITSMISDQKGNTGDNRADWTWDDYQEKDVSALEKMQDTDKEKFIRIYKAKFKTEPKF